MAPSQQVVAKYIDIIDRDSIGANCGSSRAAVFRRVVKGGVHDAGHDRASHGMGALSFFLLAAQGPCSCPDGHGKMSAYGT
jgi:hypothetical protein